MSEFKPFPKLARLRKNCVITEKLDGTNASVLIVESSPEHDGVAVAYFEEDGVSYSIFAGSRNRWVTPEDDNYGFAFWVKNNAVELQKLGLGQHYGEWWGRGIQRNYGMAERKFSLFNTMRWQDGHQERPACCDVVPILYQGDFCTFSIDTVMVDLGANGSTAVPGFMDPEGIVIFHQGSNTGYKKTFGGDGHKGATA